MIFSSWGQTSAEMVAAQISNNNKKMPVLGLVTNGTTWQFGKLEENVFTIDERTFSATNNFNKVFNILNCFFAKLAKM